MEGEIFEDRFRILSVLGQGAMGVVYKAKQIHMDKIVAIKTLQPSVLATDLDLRRFEQEAKAASNLTHANIITVYDFGISADGGAYLVMEYLGSRSLDGLLKSQKRLDLELFLRIFTQICDGMQHAHKKGVIHRDMKPSNVMLVDDEEASNIVKVVDFGLAKLVSADAQQHLTQTGSVMGTPLYMSPEQCRGSELDNRSDIYSVGCMMYAALTGGVPHMGDSPLSTLYKHLSEPPPPFSVSAPDIRLPDPVEMVVQKALQKDPAQRQQSMAELRSELMNAVTTGRYPTTSDHLGSPSGESSPESQGSSPSAAATASLPAGQVADARQQDRLASARADDGKLPTEANQSPASLWERIRGIRSPQTSLPEESPSSSFSPLLTASITAIVVVAIGGFVYVMGGHGLSNKSGAATPATEASSPVQRFGNQLRPGVRQAFKQVRAPTMQRTSNR